LKKFIYILLLLTAFKASAQVTDTIRTDTGKKAVNPIDTIKKDLFTAPDTVQHLHSKKWALVPPAVLVAYGASNFIFKPVRNLDKSIYNDIYKSNPNFNHHPENYLQYAPAALVYGLNLVGVHGKNTFIDRSLIYLMSQGMLEGVTFFLKKTTHRVRPNNGDDLSFPSGHTGNAFANAEFMSQEFSGKSVGYGIVGYGFATATGVLRIYNRDHWFSDVVAGAGFGILATKGAYLLYPYIRNSLFKGDEDKPGQKNLPPDFKKKPGKSAILLPSFQGGTLGLQFAMQL
jgi:hypothetical protein